MVKSKTEKEDPKPRSPDWAAAWEKAKAMGLPDALAGAYADYKTSRR